MNEIGMSSIDEGVSLNQLILLYNKYRIKYHCVDFKYHKTASHHDHDYKPNTNYPAFCYMIEGQHLYPIRQAEQHKAIPHTKTKENNISSQKRKTQ